MACRKDGTRSPQGDNRPVDGVASALQRGWSYHWRIAPDGRGFDSPQLHQQLLTDLIAVAPDGNQRAVGQRRRAIDIKATRPNKEIASIAICVTAAPV